MEDYIKIGNKKIPISKETADALKEQFSFKFNSYKDIKTYKDVCEYLEIKHDKDTHPAIKIEHIATAFNRVEGVENFPDWENIKQEKYYPYFNCSGGVRFHASFCYCYGSFGLVGFYFNEELSDYAGNTFIKEYTDLMSRKFC